ncbi:MAG: GNAT family N-acetyltransferase [Clostridia bacterium]|nr:GNAT family N-acetyltransferase [Clostridia bacterium]
MNPVLCRQLAADYCCSVNDVLDRQNHFTVHQYLDGRRRFQESDECFLKIAAVNGKLLFSGNSEILTWCTEQFENDASDWFFEAENLHRLNERLYYEGYRIGMVHPFYIAEQVTDAGPDVDVSWFEKEEINQFQGDPRFNEAVAFDKNAQDMLAVAAVKDGQILGMAGASCDSPTMWQIGINVMPESRTSGIGTRLVSLLKNEVLKRGILPFYGTSMSHIASQRVAIGAGFMPAWAELVTTKV